MLIKVCQDHVCCFFWLPEKKFHYENRHREKNENSMFDLFRDGYCNFIVWYSH